MPNPPANTIETLCRDYWPEGCPHFRRVTVSDRVVFGFVLDSDSDMEGFIFSLDGWLPPAKRRVAASVAVVWFENLAKEYRLKARSPAGGFYYEWKQLADQYDSATAQWRPLSKGMGMK